MDAINCKSEQTYGVPVDSGLIAEFHRRAEGAHIDVAAVVELLLVNYLNEAPTGNVGWKLKGLSGDVPRQKPDQLKRCGSPTEGYQWQTLFLPNGTRLMAKYKGKQHIAEVQFSEIVDNDGGPYSPSEWASKVANNTSRNAWRDIWVQRSFGEKFQLADVLRRKTA